MEHNLYSPTYLRSLCERYGLRPSKEYGQNYLVTEKYIETMVEAGGVGPDDTVIEVGPGFGALTFALAKKAKRVIAFEIEKKIEPYWEEWQRDLPNVELIWGNALSMLNEKIEMPKGYKVIANLPYQITSHVLRTILELPEPPERMVVMVQKEVGERIVAKPGDMSLLALSVQYYGTPKVVAKVTKGNFFPAPKVDSAILAITNIHPREGADVFFRLAKVGFANKRKYLVNNIASGLHLPLEQVREAVVRVVGNEKVRAEELGVEDWKNLVDTLGLV